MEIDKTTLTDLSMFQNREEVSVFDKLDLCTTAWPFPFQSFSQKTFAVKQ